MDSSDDASRRLTAADVNNLAQALDEGALPVPTGTETAASGEGALSNESQGAGGNATDDAVALEDTFENRGAPETGRDGIRSGIFPPEPQDQIEIGGSVEDREALREEYRHP